MSSESQLKINRTIETCLAIFSFGLNVPVIIFMIKLKKFRPLTILLLNIFIINILFGLTKITYWYGLVKLPRTSLKWKVLYVLVMKIISPALNWNIALTTLVIAVQCWIAAKYPFKSPIYLTNQLTKRSLLAVHLFSFIISGGLAIPFMMNKVELARKIQFIGLIPCVILFILYTDIIICLKRFKYASPDAVMAKRTTFFCIAFTLTFLASYLPLLINDMFNLGATKYVVHTLWLDGFMLPIVFLIQESKKLPLKSRSFSQKSNLQTVSTRLLP